MYQKGMIIFPNKKINKIEIISLDEFLSLDIVSVIVVDVICFLVFAGEKFSNWLKPIAKISNITKWNICRC